MSGLVVYKRKLQRLFDSVDESDVDEQRAGPVDACGERDCESSTNVDGNCVESEILL
jgi:hypothetical protein